MPFTYNTNKLSKKNYQMFLGISGTLTKTMKDSDDIEFMSKFRGDTVKNVLSGNLTVSNDTEKIIAFYNTASSTVTVSATDEKPRFVINLGTSTVVIGGITLSANEIAILPCGGAVSPFKTPYIPIGVVEAGMYLNIVKGDVKNISTGDELVISDVAEFNANVFGANDWLDTLLTNKLCSVGMVELGIEAGIFVKNVYPNTELNIISNDSNMTKVFLKSENAIVELV